MVLTEAEIERAVKMLDGQKKYCAQAIVPTYAAILEAMIEDTRKGGPICEVLQHWDGIPESVFALRILGALHRLVLGDQAPKLAAIFPSAGGTAAPELAGQLARDVLAANIDFVIGYCARPPQTNEVGRSSVLLGGFLTIAQQFGQPLRLLEIGASAGLNLMWDKYRVVTDQFSWGDASATLELRPKWEGSPPPLTAPIAVASRAACDRDPILLSNADDRLRLESYIWPDQVHRMARLRLAYATALNTPFRLDKADAADWLGQELRTLPKGQTTVVFHSIFRQYLDLATDARLEATMAEAGVRATKESPLAWLTMEVADFKSFPNLTLTVWPGGTAKTLASAHHHGEWIKWNG